MNSVLWRCAGLTIASVLGALLIAEYSLAAEYKVPRLADGKPDLQGTWTNATATPVERAVELGDRRVYSDAEADAIQKKAVGAVEADARPTDPNEKQKAGNLPPVGNYNLFWTDRGMNVAVINGEKRTSMIIDPPSGRIPALTAQARQRMVRRGFRGGGGGGSGSGGGGGGEGEGDFARGGFADGPEQRGLGERCLLSFGSSGGPPMLPTMYNSYYQIVQTPDYMVFLVEMVHDARIVRMNDKHVTGQVRKWLGDSIGHWEGDTLVVETEGFRPDQTYRGSSEHMKVVERFTRVAADQIVYSFTIEDPTAFTAPFTGELAFTPANGNIYEYACHEGNYALPGILAAEREKEKAEAASPRK